MSKHHIFEQIESFHKITQQDKDRLTIYVELLTHWNKKINLIASDQDIWQRHILDAAQLLKFIPIGTKNLTDFGAGGGIPSIILSVIASNTHIEHIDAIESIGKKATFLRTVIRECALDNITIHNQRIEDLQPWKSAAITARAFAPLDKLLEYIYPFCQKDSLCILPKGANFEKEIEDAKKYYNFNVKISPTIIDDINAGVILELDDISRLTY